MSTIKYNYVCRNLIDHGSIITECGASFKLDEKQDSYFVTCPECGKSGGWCRFDGVSFEGAIAPFVWWEYAEHFKLKNLDVAGSYAIETRTVHLSFRHYEAEDEATDIVVLTIQPGANATFEYHEGGETDEGYSRAHTEVRYTDAGWKYQRGNASLDCDGRTVSCFDAMSPGGIGDHLSIGSELFNEALHSRDFTAEAGGY